MQQIRVFLASAPVRLRAAVRIEVRGQPDLLMVGDANDEIETLLGAGKAGADVVIVGMSGAGLPPVVERLADEYPHIGVVAVDLDRDEGLVLRLRPRLTRITAIAAVGMAAAIRLAADEIGD